MEQKCKDIYGDITHTKKRYIKSEEVRTNTEIKYIQKENKRRKKKWRDIQKENIYGMGE